jgi:hypothetical protein
MVSLDKTTHSIQLGRYRAHINAGIRRNNLTCLWFEFGEQVLAAETKAFEAHKAEVLAR